MKTVEKLELEANQAALWLLGQAVELTAFVKPRYALPNHYDMMALNAENPQTFRWLCRQRQVTTHCVIPTIMEPFVWA